MCRDSTPLLRTRSRLHQLPVVVLSSSGLNHTCGACGTKPPAAARPGEPMPLEFRPR